VAVAVAARARMESVLFMVRELYLDVQKWKVICYLVYPDSECVYVFSSAGQSWSWRVSE
jgi:hypothetical protein